MVNGKISRNYFASDSILNIQYPTLQYFRLNFYFVKKNIIILQLQSDKFLHLYRHIVSFVLKKLKPLGGKLRIEGESSVKDYTAPTIIPKLAFKKRNE